MRDEPVTDARVSHESVAVSPRAQEGCARPRDPMTVAVAAAEGIRRHYQVVIVASVTVGLLLGVWTTTPGRALQAYAPALTFLMILFTSVTITPRQMALVARQRAAVATGLVLNFAYMPLLSWALARLLVQDAELATGLILVGVVPSAGMAAVWTALLRGDVPLSMAINGLTMVLAPFLIPLLMLWLGGAHLQIDSWGMFRQLATILLLPLALGVAARAWADWRQRWIAYLPLLPVAAALTAVLLMFAVCNVNVPLLVARSALVPPLLLATGLIFPLGFVLPHVVGRFAFSPPQRVAITYASGMKNLPIAAGLAFSGFSALVGLPVAVAMILQMLTASVLYRYLRREDVSPGRVG
jgi:BASS family bile acid:Na+ symporter